MSTKHADSAKQFLYYKGSAQWHNETLWFVRHKRDLVSRSLPEWETLRELSSQIKRHTISHLDTYLEQFAANAEANGAIVHWAVDAKEHNDIVFNILKKHKVRKSGEKQIDAHRRMPSEPLSDGEGN